MALGIIGFGAFSELLVKHLKPFFSILVYSRRDIKEQASALGVEVKPLAEVAACDIVIVGVVAQHFEKTIKEIKNLVRPGSLILDVTSVKVKPARLMQKYLPEFVDIIATHPLFGPQSAKNGIKNLKIVLCPIRIKPTRFDQIKKIITQKSGLITIIKTPEAHDKEMAYVQALTHFIGRAINELAIPQSQEATKAYESLLKIKELLGQDSWDLFLTIEKENPYAKIIRKKFINQLQKLEKKIN